MRNIIEVYLIKWTLSISRHLILIPTFFVSTTTGKHWSLHKGRDPEESGGHFPGDLRPGPKEDLRPDGERLLRSLPAVWAVPGAPGQLIRSRNNRGLGGGYDSIKLYLETISLKFANKLLCVCCSSRTNLFDAKCQKTYLRWPKPDWNQ